ncbi:MAG: hypothetical protein EG826_13820 [Deltaproteobacteria bacterium]|nr:hypothetical protein [Deltaproteobacteria bacterium]
MQTASGISTLQITINENRTRPTDRELFREKMRRAEETDWDQVIARIDTYTARAGAALLALSILYFAPILVSILLR